MEELELLSKHLDNLLGQEYQALSKAFHALQTKEGASALEADEHRAHLAILHSLLGLNDPDSISLIIIEIIKECLPYYHFRYEKERETSIRSALAKVKNALEEIRTSHWSKRDLALKELTAIAQGYESILSRGIEYIKTRVPVAILEEGYYSLDVETARRLLCINEQGKEYRENTSGAHAVCAADGIHYKPDPSVVVNVNAEARNILPISPAKEYAVSSLLQRLAGDSLTAAPTGLLSIQDVPLENADFPLTSGLVQAGLTIKGICLREFLLLREALRFFKRLIGEEKLVLLLEDQKKGYPDYLALAKKHFPHIFIDSIDFSTYPLCSIHQLEIDLQKNNGSPCKKIYISEEHHQYTFLDNTGELRTKELPLEFDLSTLNAKLEDISFHKKILELLRENDRTERSNAFRYAFEHIGAKCPITDCFAEMEDADGRSEFNKARIFREVYEKYSRNLDLLRLLVSLSDTYPQLMSGQSISSCLKFLKSLQSLFELFSQQTAAQAIPEIEKVLSHYLDKKSLSALLLGLMLCLPQDSKTDNFRLKLFYNEAKELQGCCIVSIDNDMGLEMPFSAEILDESNIPRLGLRLKNSLYWLDELMQEYIHPDVRSRLLSSSARSQWLSWLCLIARRNQEAQGLQSLVPQPACADFPLRLPPETLHFILEQWQKLQQILEEPAEMSHQELLNRLYPTLAAAYEAIRQSTRNQIAHASVIDYEQTLYSKCADWGCYFFPADTQQAVTEYSPQLYALYKQGLSQCATADGSLCEVSEFVLNILRTENWLQHSPAEQWFLVQAFGLLNHSNRQDWEHTIPEEQRQALWQSWLLQAIYYGEPFIARQLLDLGANVGLVMGEFLKTPLHHFCEVYLSYEDATKAKDMAHILLSHYSCQPNAYDAMGYTPLLQWANIKPPDILGEERTQLAESILGALCRGGADINLMHGEKNYSLLDKMVQQNHLTGFILAVAYGARICCDMQAALQWCYTHLEEPQMRGTLKKLKENSLSWAWWLGLTEWQQAQGGYAVEGVISRLFSLPLPLWKAWERAALNLPEDSPIEGIQVTREAEGRRAVRGVEYKGIKLHIKPRPEMAAVEFAVALLLNGLFGELVAPSDCLAISDDKKEVHPALFSQTVPGTSLKQTLEALPDAEAHLAFQQQLDKRQTSAQILGAMLIYPEDGKSDNYRLTPYTGLDGAESYHIIAIDNDHAFIEPLAEDGSLELKTILFCLEAMREPVHPVWRDRILSLSIPAFLKNWLEQIKEYQKRAHHIFKHSTRIAFQEVGWMHQMGNLLGSSKADLPVVMTFPLHEKAVIALYERFNQLQSLLRDHPTITHLTLLKYLCPALGKLYGNAFATYPLPHQVLMRFEILCHKAYGKEGQTIKTTAAVLQAMRLPKKQEKAIRKQDESSLFTPRHALDTLAGLKEESLHKMAILNELYLKGYSHKFIGLRSRTLQMEIIHELDFRNFVPIRGSSSSSNANKAWDIPKQQRVLQCIAEARIAFTRLAIEHCAALDELHLETLLKQSPQLVYLKLVDCPGLSNKVFALIAKYGKSLIALTIVQCHSLTAMEWGAFEPTFLDLAAVRIEENFNLKKIRINGPNLNRINLGGNPVLESLNLNGDELIKRDEKGRTPLLRAAAQGDIARVKYLLSHYVAYVSLQDKDNEGKTALMLAAKNGDVTTVDYLLSNYSKQALPDQEDNEGCTAYILAIHSGNDALIDCLQGKHPQHCHAPYPSNINSFFHTEKNRQSLFQAIANGKIEDLDRLSPSPLTLMTEKDSSGDTPLLCAARYGRIAMFEHLYRNYFLPDMAKLKLLHSYRFRLMSSLPHGDTSKAEQETFYLSEDSTYVVIDPAGNIREGSLISAGTDWSNFRIDKLEEPAFQEAILKITANRQHTYSFVSGCLLFLQKENNGRTALFYAIENSDYPMIYHLLVNYPLVFSLRDRNRRGQTAICFAIDDTGVDENMLSSLLASYPKQILLRDQDHGKTIVHYVIRSGSIKKLHCLLSHFPRIIRTNNKDENPLLIAISTGQLEIFEYLLLHYPEEIFFEEKTSKRENVLMIVADNEQITMLDHLVLNYSKQVSLQKKNNDRKTFLHYVAENGLIKIFDHIMSRYPEQISLQEKDNFGQTATMLAKKEGCFHIANHIESILEDYKLSLFDAIKSGDTLKIGDLVSRYPFWYQDLLPEKDEEGKTVLHYAAESGQTTMLDCLLEIYGKKLSLSDRDNSGKTPLLCAAEKGQDQTITYLLKKYRGKVSIEEKDYNGQTALLLALKNRHFSTFYYIADAYRANLETEDNNGMTALIRAAENKNSNIIGYLLQPNPHHKPRHTSFQKKNKNGLTPLLWAVTNGNIAMLHYLLSKYLERISLRETDNNGRSPLLCAAAAGQIEMFEHLLLHYSDQVSLTEKTPDGKNALVLATENGQEEMRIHLLEKYGAQLSMPSSESSSLLYPISSSPFRFGANFAVVDDKKGKEVERPSLNL